MRATGIVRRVDDIGRVMIPKEIRRILSVNEGTPLEIFIDGEGILLKKYPTEEDIQRNINILDEVIQEHSQELGIAKTGDLRRLIKDMQTILNKQN
jgi:AbrB family looped-hinge helix DNA binding protein